MKRVIWKYRLDIGENDLSLPEESLGLTVVAQSTGLYLFVTVPVDVAEAQRRGEAVAERTQRVIAVPTGASYDDSYMAWVASVRPREGEQFMHVFVGPSIHSGPGTNDTGPSTEQDDTDEGRSLPPAVGIVFIG